MSLCSSNLFLQGYSCTLFQDDVKSKEINRGALLVPYNGDKSIMIDRFDCRGHLNDLQSYGGPFNELQLSHEEWESEQSCNFERYYDLYHTNDSNLFESESRGNEDEYEANKYDPSRYSAIRFDYDSKQEKNVSQICKSEREIEDNGNDAAYICPPNLKLLPGMITPATEREAAIIEQTAKFVADKGPQLEILIKAKQSNNPKFVFLNFDNKLYPFYRHVTHLIKTAQYIPGKRHISHLVESNNDQSQMSSFLQPVAPKIDISSTPYGKLIERFKQAQEKRKLDREKTGSNYPNENGNSNKNLNNSHSSLSILESESDNLDSISMKAFVESSSPPASASSPSLSRSPSPGTVELQEARHKMYEDLYQQYYPYYYQYYYELYGSTESSDKLVEMARSYAASSAASWIQSNMPADPTNNRTTEESQDTVIGKMAEYVARNGVEFEQMMLARNSERFAFLLPGHANHCKYKILLDKQLIKLQQAPRRSRSRSRSPEQSIASIVDDSYGQSPPHHSSGPISFKVTSKLKTVPVRSSNYVDNIAQIEDLDDDFDFTDKLQVKSESTNSSSRTSKNGRISRFSPANPKNLLVLATFKNDLQIQRKRKAAEFLASRMLKDKITKSDPSTQDL